MPQMPADHPTSINSKWIYCYYYAYCSQYIFGDLDTAIAYYKMIVETLRPRMALAMYHLSVAIVSRWMEKKKQNKEMEQFEEVSLDEVEESVSVRSEYGQEQIEEFKYALRMIESANQMRSTPIVKEHYDAILGKIRPVLKGLSDGNDDGDGDYKIDD